MFKKIVFTLCAAYVFPVFTAQSADIPYDPNPEGVPGYRYVAPRIQGNIDNFSGEKVVVLSRGINFLREKFTREERLDFITSEQIGHPMFCSAAYELANLDYDSDQFDDLMLEARIVANHVNELDNTGEITINGMEFSSYRFAFQQLYSNNCQGFFKQMHHPEGEYEPVFDDLPFTKNPHLSFSYKLKHPLKYAGGVKNYGTDTALLPRYDLTGTPRHPILGKFFGVILDEAAIEELEPLNVAKAHRNRELKLLTHFRNDIFSEREITIAGYVPGENVVFEMPFEVPSFSGEYKSYYKKKYGLTQTRYNNFSKFFKKPEYTNEQRKEKEKSLINSLIEASYQANDLAYENCLVPKINKLFNTQLEQIDAEIGKLNLDFTIG